MILQVQLKLYPNHDSKTPENEYTIPSLKDSISNHMNDTGSENRVYIYLSKIKKKNGRNTTYIKLNLF